MDGKLFWWTSKNVLLTFIHGEETRLVIAETHERAAGNHSGGRAVAPKVESLGHYWATMVTDCKAYAQKYDKCQRHASNIHRPTGIPRTMIIPYPLIRWEMDITRPLGVWDNGVSCLLWPITSQNVWRLRLSSRPRTRRRKDCLEVHCWGQNPSRRNQRIKSSEKLCLVIWNKKTRKNA